MADFLTVVHEVKDFAAWKPGYDADAPNRKGAGVADLMLVRESANPNIVALLFGIDDLAAARAMAGSDALREAMQKAGVVGAPNVHFRRGEFTRKDAANYLTINCKIKDIGTFKNGYAMDKADRLAAGLTDLGVLTDIDEPNDLLLIWSVDDVAKATAFLQSPALAEHQVKNAGVVSEPTVRFWTR